MTADRFDIVDYTTPIAYQESAVLIRVPDRKDYVAHIFMKAFGWKVRMRRRKGQRTLANQIHTA